MRKIAVTLGLGLAIFFLSAGQASASEGIIQLRNTIGGQSRCFAESVLMPDFNYTVLVSCRDLVYPVSSELLSYVLWASPIDGGSPIKLGDLSLGKVEFKTKTAFANLFATQERDNGVKNPGGPLVMRGSVEQIPLLQNPNLATEPQTSTPPLVTPFPSPAPSNLISKLRSGAVVTVISIFLIIVMLILVKPFK